MFEVSYIAQHSSEAASVNLFSVAQTFNEESQCACKQTPQLTMHAGSYNDTIGDGEVRAWFCPAGPADQRGSVQDVSFHNSRS